MQTVTLKPVPSQTVNVLLNNQATTVNVYQKGDWLFCDLLVNNAVIIGGVICQNANLIVRDAYLGFVGDIAFFDLQGETDPVYTGLGSRYILGYIPPPVNGVPQ
jgi:hypothetical protein